MSKATCIHVSCTNAIELSHLIRYISYKINTSARLFILIRNFKSYKNIFLTRDLGQFHKILVGFL